MGTLVPIDPTWFTSVSMQIFLARIKLHGTLAVQSLGKRRVRCGTFCPVSLNFTQSGRQSALGLRPRRGVVPTAT